jgi:uncharacterized sporulation protein YeaH/YhbH (DUF444 family)
MLYLIDRRTTTRTKSALNRERFLRRYKEHIRRAVQSMVAKRSIADMAGRGGEVSIPARDIAEPVPSLAGGNREIVSPGNREFAKGDACAGPGAAGGGAARGPAAATASTSSPSASRARSFSISSKTWSPRAHRSGAEPKLSARLRPKALPAT